MIGMVSHCKVKDNYIARQNWQHKVEHKDDHFIWIICVTSNTDLVNAQHETSGT